MGEALFWGLLAGSSLVLGALVVLVHRPSEKTLGLVMAFGAGVLLSAVAYELVEESITVAHARVPTGAGFFAGAIVFVLGDSVISRLGDTRRKEVGGAPPDGNPMAIVLGAVLDGVPESMVIGLTLVAGGEVGLAILVAVFVSNLPESIAASSGLLSEGWSRNRVLELWTGIAVVSGAAAAVGFAIGNDASPEFMAFVLAFAGGAILCMLATSMMPEAFEHAGRPAGVLTTIGFAVALSISFASA